MKILFVSSTFPRDLRTNVHGVFKRMGMFIEGMKDIASLDMLFYVPPETDVSPSSVSALQSSLSKHWNADIQLFLCQTPRFNDIKKKSKLSKLWHYYGAGAFSFFKQTGFIANSGPQQVQAFESCLLGNPDAIYVHRLRSMCPLLLTRKKLPPIYFDLDDIEHISFKRSSRLLPRWHEKALNYMKFPMLLLGQLRAIRMAHHTFVCSEQDTRFLTNRWSLSGVVTIPNAVDIPDNRNLTEEPVMMFLGSYNYQPNVLAAEFLIEKVWPRVYEALPSARMIIAGAYPERIRGFGDAIPGITFTGFVDDLELLYQRVRVVCAPIFSGGGTRVKIIEAAAYGKPVVATSLGAEGLEMYDGRELLLRDNAESFAEACILLLGDYNLCRQLGSAGREKVIARYDRKQIIGLIQEYLKN